MTKSGDQQFKLRLPEALKKRLEESAVRSGRSVTAEVVARLESTFPMNFESEILEKRTEELKTLEWQIYYLDQEREGVTRRFRKSNLAPGTPDHSQFVARVADIDSRIELFREMAHAAQDDIARILAARNRKAHGTEM